MRNVKINAFIILLILALIPKNIFAAEQSLDDQEILNVEGLYKNTNSKKETPTAEVNTVPSQSLQPGSVEDKNEAVVEKATKTNVKVEKIADLNKLSSFSEISVIQKKYLPKTERFQLYAGVGTTTNSPWFLNLGAKFNLGYYFTESFGVELSGIILSNSERQVSKEIRDNNSLQPEKFVNTKNYIGADIVWAPIYGKLSLLNERIIPFDMYFSAGAGSSSTNSQEGSVPTFHIGTGQIFAINKAFAFRWDYSWSFFQATPFIANGSASSSQPQKNTYNDLILTAGFSFFFPEAKYR